MKHLARLGYGIALLSALVVGIGTYGILVAFAVFGPYVLAEMTKIDAFLWGYVPIVLGVTYMFGASIDRDR
jgi:hypothetical protein